MPEALLAWRSSRLAEGVANRTANMDVSSLQALLNWAVRSELILRNPIARVRALPAGEAQKLGSKTLYWVNEVLDLIDKLSSQRDEQKPS